MSVPEVFRNKSYEEKPLALLVTCKEVGLEVNTEKTNTLACSCLVHRMQDTFTTWR